MRYRVLPGLYAVGAPTPESPVLVSANYKMSFDRLRSQLSDRDAWILVLDTRGINVWCAAGKGTFGTVELVTRVNAARLNEVVVRRRLILPQLGATGVSAHEVKRQCGFRVIFGPVRAEDLPAFLDNGLKATSAMRRVRFSLWDRMVLVPVEIVKWTRMALLIGACLVLLSGLGRDGYALARVGTTGVTSVGVLLGTVLASAVLVPALLPWLPGRAFAVKGLWIGVVCALGMVWHAVTHPGTFTNWAIVGSWALFIPAGTSFIGVNFTGSSTYTSLSGVLKEMRLAVPLQIAFAAAAAVLWVVGLFL